MSLRPGQVRITVRSSLGEDGPLAVQDALRQVLDYFDLLSLAQGRDDQSSVTWHLVDITMASPLTAVGEAAASVPGVPVAAISRLARERVGSGLASIAERGLIPDWMDKEAQEKTRGLLYRNLNGIGRTDFHLDQNSPVVVIVERTARAGLIALDRAVLDRQSNEQDLSRTELGSIEGDVTDATTHYGKPAIRLRERVTGAEVVCVMSPDLAEKIGDRHAWREVWTGHRMMVSGEVVYKKDGTVLRVHADDMRPMDVASLSFSDLAIPGITGDLAPQEYLDSLWPGDDG